MKMQYWKCRLNAVWVELYAEKAEDPFDAAEIIRLMNKRIGHKC